MMAEHARGDVATRKPRTRSSRGRGAARRANGCGVAHGDPLATLRRSRSGRGRARSDGARIEEKALRAGLADDDLIRSGGRALHPLRRSDPTEGQAPEQYVGVPLRTAGFQKRAGARFVGGRVLPVHHERAAMLQFEIVNGSDVRRASLFTYDPRKIRVNEEELVPRAMGTAEVRVAQANGYSVALTQRAGVGYMVVSDLDTERTAQLVAFTDE